MVSKIKQKEYSSSEEEASIDSTEEQYREIDNEAINKLKNKLTDWLNYDDKIKVLNAKTKKYKDAKKQQEELIMKMLTKLQYDEMKFDVPNTNGQIRSRVYKHKSVTKESYKETIIKDALMEAIRDEKKVDQLLKKIDSKRPIKERYYLKRTKGGK